MLLQAGGEARIPAFGDIEPEAIPVLAIWNEKTAGN